MDQQLHMNKFKPNLKTDIIWSNKLLKLKNKEHNNKNKLKLKLLEHVIIVFIM